MAEPAALVFGAIVGLVAAQVLTVAATVLAGWVLGVVVPAAGFGNRPPVLGVRVFGTRLYLADGWWAGGSTAFLPFGRIADRWRGVAFFAAGPVALFATAVGAAVAGFHLDTGIDWRAIAGFTAVLGLYAAVQFTPGGPPHSPSAGSQIRTVLTPGGARPNLLAYVAERHAVRNAYEPLGDRRIPAVFADFAATAWAGLGATDAAVAALAAADDLRDPTASPEERILTGFARGDVHRVCGRFDEAEAAFLAVRREFPGAPQRERVWLDILAADCASRAGRPADAEKRLAAWHGVDLSPVEAFAREVVRNVVRVRAGTPLSEAFPHGVSIPPEACEVATAVWLIVLVADEFAASAPARAADGYGAAITTAFAHRPEFAPDEEAAFVAATDDLLLRFRRAVSASGGNASTATTDLLAGLYRPPATAAAAVSDEDAEEVQWRDFRRGLVILGVASPTAFGLGTAAVAFGLDSGIPAVKSGAITVLAFVSMVTVLFILTTIYCGSLFVLHSFRPDWCREYGTRLLGGVVMSLVVAAAGTILVLVPTMR